MSERAAQADQRETYRSRWPLILGIVLAVFSTLLVLSGALLLFAFRV